MSTKQIGGNMLLKVLLVAIGSSLGGVSRYGVSSLASRWFAGTFPVGTLIVNVLGSFLLGWLLTRLSIEGRTWLPPDEFRLLVGVGFCGAFTTFSTFEFETNALLRDGESVRALLYVATSLLLGLIALRAGIILARGD